MGPTYCPKTFCILRPTPASPAIMRIVRCGCHWFSCMLLLIIRQREGVSAQQQTSCFSGSNTLILDSSSNCIPATVITSFSSSIAGVCFACWLVQKRKVRQLATLLLNVAKLLFCQLSQLHLMAPFPQEWNLVELSHLRSALCQKEKAKSHFLAASLVARLLLLLLCGRDECSDASFGPAGSRCAACCWRHLPACDHGGGKAVSGKR